ncbi:T9SS C-terminal target domain-containing protein [Oleiharenicola lentus]|uniref:T9SS C-terminal target domain-containing protein n=1 Tax=Oleiharenicola lentus TaxID=2508720 RepID=UPI003F660F1C
MTPLVRSLLCVSLFATALVAHAAPLRVDLGMASDRRDTGKPGWIEWQVKNGTAAERDFNGVRVVLSSANGEFTGAWNRAGFVTGALLASDGIFINSGPQPATLELELRGLPAGPHTLATYHNSATASPLSPLTISVEGTSTSTTCTPSVRVSDDADAATAFLQFIATAGEPVIVRFSSTGTLGLNGFALDVVDPAKQAKKPFPFDGDEHADGDSGNVSLQWEAAASGITQQLYLASGDDAASTEKNFATAMPQSVTGSQARATLVARDSLRYYRWRVDSAAADGTITRGDSWTFRVRHTAFPTAEGYGRFALGGRGGRVIKVTSLEDSGPGSLRAAVEAEGPRTVIFDVSGRIVLKSKLIVRNPYLTIAGQTAPGKGICVSNYNLGVLGAHDVIIRFMRVRPGDTSGKTLDGMGMASANHVIFDHCSISWTQDESFSSRGAKNITLQRTLISEALNVGGHKNYAAGKQHGFAASISGDIGSFHHNLLAHCAGRNWSLAGGLDRAGVHAGRLDIRNNVVYNWSTRTTDGGAKQVNFVSNYYKPGAATKVFHVLKPERASFGPQDYYVEGNVMEGRYGADQTLAGVLEPKEEPLKNFIKHRPFFPSFVATQSAADAYVNVLADVGCNVPALDDHDQRVIRETRDGTTTYVGSKSGLPGLPDSQNDVGGWEDYPEVHRPANWDTDNDGIPDAWEIIHNLDPKDPADAARLAPNSGYTYLENYLSELAGDAKRTHSKSALAL